MALTASLTQQYTDLHSVLPVSFSLPIKAAAADTTATFNLSTTIQVGDKLPPFVLPDATSKEVRSTDLLANGPLLITFYRGSWCPFCNLTLRAYQSYLDSIKAKGVTFVAVSAELPDTSSSTIKNEELAFPVLSDVGNVYAKQLGLVFKQMEELKSVFGKEGLDLGWEQRYGVEGGKKFEVAVPATILVDREGVVRNLFVDTNYWKRLEPERALQWIDELGV